MAWREVHTDEWRTWNNWGVKPPEAETGSTSSGDDYAGESDPYAGEDDGYAGGDN